MFFFCNSILKTAIVYVFDSIIALAFALPLSRRAYISHIKYFYVDYVIYENELCYVCVSVC